MAIVKILGVLQMRKLGVGVLGVGEMGKRHAENLRRLVPQAQLVAIADPFPERARETAAELEIEKYFTSLDDMLACKEVETVVIATPDKFHASAITATARAGRNILCEKPIALTVADAEAAVAEVAKAGVRMQIGFMRRCSANVGFQIGN
jgi:myo-inositol 2-dehydrogenase/D-chiro-inositol 1-dehydrogenase